MTDVMLDLETLSTRSTACILILAAIKFERSRGLPSLEKIPKENIFYRKISSESCINVGMDTDVKTLEWWRTQKPEVQDEALGGNRDPLKTVLDEFKKWFGNSVYVWSHGATFDIPILAEAYFRVGIEVPWKFFNARDTRTIFDLGRLNYTQDRESREKENKMTHHALHDCYQQILSLQKVLKKLDSK